MDEQQRYLLISNRKAIEQDLLVADIFSYLQSKLVIEYEDVELVKSEPTSKQKTEKLIDVLLRKQRNTYKHFYNALKYAEYNHLAELLEEGVRDIHEIDESSDDSDEDTDLADIETILKNGGVPKLPQNFIERQACVEELRNALFKLQSEDGWVVLHGMAGSGKTVLSIDALHDENLIHSCFPGGIYWITIGRIDESRLLMKMQNLCSWLDPEQIYAIPKNLEEARDRLRILFANEHPRSLLVLDDLWSASDAKYFDIHVRTLATSRYAAVASKISGLVIKVPAAESLNILQSQQILAKWTGLSVKDLPAESDSIISLCKGSPLAIAMIGALLKNHNNRWGYYLKQLENQNTSKVKSKLSYQYSTLYDALAVSFDELDGNYKSFYQLLAVFEEDETIFLGVLVVLWNLDEVEAEDVMDELIERSLVCQNMNSSSTSYNIHDIQLSYLKEKALTDGKLKEYHSLLVDRYMEKCNGDFHQLEDDHYVFFSLISHLLYAERFAVAVSLLQDFSWIQKAIMVTGPAVVINSYKKLLNIIQEKHEFEEILVGLNDICRIISMQSHVFSISKEIDFIQIVLCKPISEFVYKLAFSRAKAALQNMSLTNSSRKTVYYDWINRPKQYSDTILLTFSPHEGYVNCCQFSHSKPSKWMVTGGADKFIKVWNVITGEEELVLEGHNDSVIYCEFAPNDEKIISCSADNTIKIWSSSTGNELLSLQGHTDDVCCCKCSHDGKYVLSASLDTHIKIWCLETGSLVGTLDEHTDVVTWCCFSPDGKMIASVSNDSTLKVWSFDDLSCVNTYMSEDFLCHCLFTSDGERIIFCTQKYFMIYSVSEESVQQFSTPSDVLVMSISPDDRYLALAHNDMAARLFDLENKVFVQFFAGHSGWLTDICFCAKGDKLVTSSHDGSCKIWEVKPTTYKTEKLRKIFDVTFDEFGTPTVVSATNKQQITLQTATHQLCRSEVFHCKVSTCVFSHNLSFVAVGFYDGTVAILNAEALNTKFKRKEHLNKINTVSCSKSNKLLVTGSEDTSCIVWRIHDGSMLTKFTMHTEMITKCLFCKDDRRILSSAFDGSLKVWDAESGELLINCGGKENAAAILTFSMSSDEKYLASCSADGECCLWSTIDGNLILSNEDSREPLRCISFSHDDSMVAVGTDDGTVMVWSVPTMESVCECEMDDDAWIMQVKFNRDNTMIVTVGNNIKWFDLKGNHVQTYHVIGSYLRSIGCTTDFQVCVTVDDLGFLYVLKRIDANRIDNYKGVDVYKMPDAS